METSCHENTTPLQSITYKRSAHRVRGCHRIYESPVDSVFFKFDRREAVLDYFHDFDLPGTVSSAIRRGEVAGKTGRIATSTSAIPSIKLQRPRLINGIDQLRSLVLHVVDRFADRPALQRLARKLL